jgi:hypothetical protein
MRDQTTHTPRNVTNENDQKIVSNENANKDDEIETKLTKSYFDCGTKDKIQDILSRDSDEEEEEEEEEGLDDPMEFSDLSDPTRQMWIVTTAALPWRTGTSINPFLRALYFVRRRLHLYRNGNVHDESEGTGTGTGGGSLNPKPGKVTLVIPWLVDFKDAQKLCGGHITETGEKGKEQQIEWIKNYADEMCGMKDEMEHLDILFYDAAYWTAFGSIFPKVDICSLIPSKEADIAILEEPEHLNWMRVPDIGVDVSYDLGGDEDEDATELESESLSTKGGTRNEELDTANKEMGTSETDVVTDSKEGDADESRRNLNELGWSHKFRFVVGVIHTNYSAYMKQYGIGTTIVGAPVINMLSSIVVRAYCHKVIRLSGVIPSYAKWKEVTSNVHGVRGDFLAKDQQEDQDKKDDDAYAPIYFIGKLLWAKGFDRMLKVQESYRKAHPEKKYFPIDVYGGGPDELEIKRAFHGRMQPNASSDGGVIESSPTRTSSSAGSEDGGEAEAGTDLFNAPSIRDELLRISKASGDSKVHVPDAYKNAKDYINAGFEVQVSDDDSRASPADDVVMERRCLVEENGSSNNDVDAKDVEKANPISILSDVSGRSISTGIATTKAAMNLADSALKAGFKMTFTQDELGDSEHGDLSYRFDPPKTLFELRRTPIPARFLGVKDHALLRNMPHKIFLNPSITEVLCTTTAEALAMGKFVIIPRHISNEFFFQFSNCLPYKTLKECVEKIQWALENEPAPLSEEEVHIFTWDAATDRMIDASVVTVREARERSKRGFDKGDSRMAWIHSQGGKNGSFIKNTFFGQTNNTKSTSEEGKEVGDPSAS